MYVLYVLFLLKAVGVMTSIFICAHYCESRADVILSLLVLSTLLTKGSSISSTSHLKTDIGGHLRAEICIYA